ncbi:hypothetical protein YC2023_051250 [Brassica napus]
MTVGHMGMPRFSRYQRMYQYIKYEVAVQEYSVGESSLRLVIIRKSIHTAVDKSCVVVMNLFLSQGVRSEKKGLIVRVGEPKISCLDISR